MIDWSVIGSAGMRVRVNHALEHATITLLSNSIPQVVLRGRSNRNGFYVLGDADAAIIQASAEEALHRLRSGQHDLAIHPFCGTNLAVTGLLAGISASAAAKLGRRTGSFPAGILAALVAVIVSQPVGLMAQRYLTTDSNMRGLQLGPVEKRFFFGKTLHFVRTVQ